MMCGSNLAIISNMYLRNHASLVLGTYSFSFYTFEPVLHECRFLADLNFLLSLNFYA